MKELEEILELAQTPLELPPHQDYFTDEEFREICKEIENIYGKPEPGLLLRAVEQEHFKVKTHQRLATYLLENQKLLIPAGLHNYPSIPINPKAKYESQGQVDIFLKNDLHLRGVHIAGWGLSDGYKVAYSYEIDKEIIANIQTRSIWDIEKIAPIYDEDSNLPF